MLGYRCASIPYSWAFMTLANSTARHPIRSTAPATSGISGIRAYPHTLAWSFHFMPAVLQSCLVSGWAPV